MRRNLGLIFAAGLVLAALAGGLRLAPELLSQEGRKSTPSPGAPRAQSLAPEVEAILARKTALVAELLKDPVIIAAVSAANEAHRALSLEEKLSLDRRWRASEEVDEFVAPFLTNDVAKKLLEFQETNPGFSEVFIADAAGLNVGQTNKTSDYYQADEAWWLESFADGRGQTSHGAIEFDESAQTEAISLYVPVRDPQTARALGVAKAVVSVAAIALEL